MATTEKLFEKIMLRLGATPEIRLARARARTVALNKRLKANYDSMKISDEILNKRCTL